MKKLLLSLLLASGVLASCSKDSGETACYACTVETKGYFEGSQDADPDTNSTIDVEQCGLTAEQARQYEASGTSTVTSSTGGITMTVKTKTTCSKK